MAWPPALPPSGRDEATEQAVNHPSDHNLTADALAEIVARASGIQTGTLLIPDDPGSSFGSGTATFAEPYATPPIVVASMFGSSASFVVEVGTVTTTTVAFTVTRHSTQDVDRDRTVSYIAIGTPA